MGGYRDLVCCLFYMANFLNFTHFQFMFLVFGEEGLYLMPIPVPYKSMQTEANLTFDPSYVANLGNARQFHI